MPHWLPWAGVALLISGILYYLAYFRADCLEEREHFYRDPKEGGPTIYRTSPALARDRRQSGWMILAGLLTALTINWWFFAAVILVALIIGPLWRQLARIRL